MAKGEDIASLKMDLKEDKEKGKSNRPLSTIGTIIYRYHHRYHHYHRHHHYYYHHYCNIIITITIMMKVNITINIHSVLKSWRLSVT
jgi:hypothetical protein